MRTRTVHLFLILLFSSAFPLIAQLHAGDSLIQFHQSRMAINEAAMITLGSWAAGNIIVGTYCNFANNGETKYFHQFNALWNVVNLGIATFGYLEAVGADPATMSGLEIIKDHQSLQSFLLLNAGLDIAYIATGLYLKERSKNSANAERLIGYGNSLLLQGGFLLLFDVVLYFIHQHNAGVHLYPHLESILAGGFGVGLNLKL